MVLSPIFQVLLVCIPVIISLFIVYIWFDMNWNYLLYFVLIFLLIFIGLGLIDWYYIAVVVLVFALLIYQAINSYVKKEREIE